jgi:hypothetical protein
VLSPATDLDATESDRIEVVIPTPDQTETITGMVGQMDRWLDEMKECAARGDLLRLLHLSATLGESNAWLAGHVDKVMDVR